MGDRQARHGRLMVRTHGIESGQARTTYSEQGVVMDEFLEQLVKDLDDWCALVLGDDFRSGGELAIVQALGSTWGDQDVKFTVMVLADFLLTEMLVAASALVLLELEVLPSELRIIARSVAEHALASQARSRGVTNFVMFMQRCCENNHGLLTAFPPRERPTVAAEGVSFALCDLFGQVEDDVVSGEGSRNINTAPLSEFLTTFLDMLPGMLNLHLW